MSDPAVEQVEALGVAEHQALDLRLEADAVVEVAPMLVPQAHEQLRPQGPPRVRQSRAAARGGFGAPSAFAAWMRAAVARSAARCHVWDLSQKEP